MKKLIALLAIGGVVVVAQKLDVAEEAELPGGDAKAVIDVDRDEDPVKPDIAPPVAFALVVEDVDAKTAIAAANAQFLVDGDHTAYVRTSGEAIAAAKTKVFQDHDVEGYYKKR